MNHDSYGILGLRLGVQYFLLLNNMSQKKAWRDHSQIKLAIPELNRRGKDRLKRIAMA